MGLAAAMIIVISATPAAADQFDDQINSLQSQIGQQQSQLAALAQQADTLSNKLASINAQVAAVTAQLQETQLQLNATNSQIDALNQKMAQEKDFLGQNIKTMYLQSGTSSLEVLVSSKNMSDYFNKQEYLDNVRGKIVSTLADLNATKTELDAKQKQLSDLTTQQKTQQLALQTQQANAQQLLADTQGQEANYQALVSQTNQKLQAVVAARAAAIRASGVNFSSGGCGGYPAKWCGAAQDSLVDTWAFYNRECVSYVAWKRWVLNMTPQPNYWGNAADWYRYVDSYTAHSGDIAVWGAYANAYIGEAGHVAFVESAGGGKVTLSQFNFDVGNGPGKYSVMTLSTNDPIMRGVGYIR